MSNCCYLTRNGPLPKRLSKEESSVASEYLPFISEEAISVFGSDILVLVTILGDTGLSQSLLLEGLQA